MVHHDLVASVFLPLDSPSSTAVFCQCSETPPPSRRSAILSLEGN